MKSKVQDIETIIAAAVWADGEFEEAEKIVVNEIAKAIGENEKEFTASIEALSNEFNGKDDAAVNAALKNAAKNINKDEVAGVLEIALQTIMADGVLSHDEVANYLAIADCLGVDVADAVLMLADATKDEDEIVIDLD